MKQQKGTSPSKDILLPGEDYVLHQWMVRAGSAVRAGDTVATAIRKDAAPSCVVSTAVTQHKRPKKRKREKPQDDEQEQENGKDGKMPAQNKPQHVIPIMAPASGMLRMEESSDDTNSKHHLQIGHVEPCQHPAIMGGLCAVCGESIGPQAQSQSAAPAMSQQILRRPPMSQVTVSGGVTMSVSETEAQLMSVQNSKRLLDHKKLCLVLDLDHTLVHATGDPRARTHYLNRQDVRTVILPVMMDEPWMPPRFMQHYVKLRPHLKEFLLEAQPLYEISVYTAGTRFYAEHVTMVLSRCMVGATRDDEDLHRLRHDVMRAEQDLNSSNAKVTDKEASSDPKAAENDVEQKQSDAHQKRASDKDGPLPKKRVTFGEPPAQYKTDLTNLEQLNELKKELQEAERLEQEALELRQRVFGSRIVSRTDVGDLGHDVKSLERIFPGGGTMAVIVDDREDVWANAEDSSKTRGEPPENLLLVRPYHWEPFLGFADVNNAAGVDISGESTHTADEADLQLLWTLDILKRIHKHLYSSEEVHRHELTVPRLLRGMRQKVLKGCTLVFSGLIPLHQQNRGTNSPRPAVVRYGESLGANVSFCIQRNAFSDVSIRDI
jgi:RNA polymerase II subunit A-like phosphatase